MNGPNGSDDLRGLDGNDPHGRTGHQEFRRGSAGRHEIVLSRRDEDGQSAHFIHVRPVARPGKTSVRFRDGNALTLMGFKARPACPMFPLACAFAGCYYLRLSGPGNDEANALRVFRPALSGPRERDGQNTRRRRSGPGAEASDPNAVILAAASRNRVSMTRSRAHRRSQSRNRIPELSP